MKSGVTSCGSTAAKNGASNTLPAGALSTSRAARISVLRTPLMA